MNQRLLSEADVEREFGINRRWLQKLRLTGDGPIYCKIGRSVRYDRKDIEDFIQASKRNSTSEDTQLHLCGRS
jgi:predicted DNA-binding transcriptional regulator AlpA